MLVSPPVVPRVDFAELADLVTGTKFVHPSEDNRLRLLSRRPVFLSFGSGLRPRQLRSIESRAA